MTKKDKFGLDEIVDFDKSKSTRSKKPLRPKSNNIPATSLVAGRNKVASRIEKQMHSMDEIKAKLTSVEKELEQKTEELNNKMGTKIQKIMPISKQLIDMVYQEVDCDLIDVSPENERDQSLLTEASLSDILPSIRLNGQMQEGLLRPNQDGRYELIDGSRRLAAVKICGGKFKALVGDVPDQDVAALSETGNQYNAPSYYEKACFYKRQISEGKYSNWSHLGKAKNISTTQLSRYKACAELDRDLVMLFIQPSDMSLNMGELLLKLHKSNKTSVNNFTQKLLQEKEIDFVEYRDKYYVDGEPTKLINLLKKSAISKHQAASPTIKKPVKYNSTSIDNVSVKHTISSSGSAKLEFVGLSDKKLNEVLDLVIKNLKLKQV